MFEREESQDHWNWQAPASLAPYFQLPHEMKVILQHGQMKAYLY